MFRPKKHRTIVCWHKSSRKGWLPGSLCLQPRPGRLGAAVAPLACCVMHPGEPLVCVFVFFFFCCVVVCFCVCVLLLFSFLSYTISLHRNHHKYPTSPSQFISNTPSLSITIARYTISLYPRARHFAMNSLILKLPLGMTP